MQGSSKKNFKVYVWDNGEDFLDHSIWFIESDLDEDIVEAILDAAIDRRTSRRGGVVAVVDSAQMGWRQMRLESLGNWFTCYGDELVDWRNRAVHEALRRLPMSAA